MSIPRLIPLPPMVAPDFSHEAMRNDVSGFRLGGKHAPNQNPMQTLNEDVSDSWAGGSSSPAHQSMQTSMQVNPSVQTHKLVSGYWGDGSDTSSHYPMQTGKLRDPSMLSQAVCFNKLAQSSMFSQQLGQRLIGLNRNNFGSGLPAEYSYSNGKKAKQDRRTQCLGRLSAT